ncbi:hypothetical protein P1X15_27435 [Runella sp. MFBS21]|uniref:hypothetical protein n=1 Tax=Runella sp. MFBS21 TaxID=3034018 RepID=UPI0023F69419|nr:hypothetical protein [Runella sp. MFBS21]MDF7821387.1 hypothetical protein [Runella sp. MFBS21]
MADTANGLSPPPTTQDDAVNPNIIRKEDVISKLWNSSIGVGAVSAVLLIVSIFLRPLRRYAKTLFVILLVAIVMVIVMVIGIPIMVFSRIAAAKKK